MFESLIEFLVKLKKHFSSSTIHAFYTDNFSFSSFQVGLPILIFHLIGEPFERGFFCNDESLLHPYKTDTVTTTMLVTVGSLVPIFVVSEFNDF
jgi:hypothetical protein